MGLELDQLELLSHQLPPVRTSATDDGATAADDEDRCATPTSEANMLRAPSLCPPAPRKPRPARAKRRQQHCYYRGRRRRCSSGPAHARYWIVAVPHDLAAVFIAARPPSPSSSPCRPPGGKKIRVHVVG
ncbi:hypothetical protein VPH35_116383 [Triticum aestivum]|uniref:Uncharacterized protein n=1 Tax=Aegilops tauschii subsp. strangulata TaxID=200361 RepID=A0A453NIW4_AEGTS|nr:uncharacterized protein LOC109756386 [Aegilops tauschii subsp. strangulata]XP_044416454.1 uncharacterized protein LOC123141344 [Triticum aestivum]